MNLLAMVGLIWFITILTSCSGGTHSAGYWFHIVFILIPLIVIGVLIIKRLEGLHDSIFTIEGQIKRLSGKLDSLDEKIKQGKSKKEP